MHYWQIQRNFRDNEYSYKLGKEYLTHLHTNLKFVFYIKFAKRWHITRISITNCRKVINFQNQSGFLAHPVCCSKAWRCGFKSIFQ